MLPGQSDRQVALIACRDAAQGSGATTSIASTAAMLEIANAFSGSTHSKTLVFVSTDGCSIGALGARRFVRDYTSADLLDGAIVLSQPASPDPEPPLVIPWSTGPQSTASQLAETTKRTISEETGTPAGDEGPLDDLFRLALPAAIGEQGPLIEGGLDAIRVSSSGELPPAAADDDPANLDSETLDRFGRASLSLMLTLDAAPGGLEHGPSAYIGLAGNLLPGWTLGLLALALLLPVAATAAVGLSASARSPAEAVRGLIWVGVRVLPFLAALVVTDALIVVGLLPSPDFPFDPATESLGVVGIALGAGGRGGARRCRLVPATAPPAGPRRRRDRAPGGAPRRRPRGVGDLARQPVSRAAGGHRAPGLGARRRPLRARAPGADRLDPGRADPGAASRSPISPAGSGSGSASSRTCC